MMEVSVSIGVFFYDDNPKYVVNNSINDSKCIQVNLHCSSQSYSMFLYLDILKLDHKLYTLSKPYATE
jgi:hypothetical protein